MLWLTAVNSLEDEPPRLLDRPNPGQRGDGGEGIPVNDKQVGLNDNVIIPYGCIYLD